VLDLDDPEIDALARELARRTGAPLADIVKEALKDKLASAPPSRHAVDWAALREIQARLSKQAAAGGVTSDHAGLYGEDGLPK
jgi:hypothetical protein